MKIVSDNLKKIRNIVKKYVFFLSSLALVAKLTTITTTTTTIGLTISTCSSFSTVIHIANQLITIILWFFFIIFFLINSIDYFVFEWSLSEWFFFYYLETKKKIHLAITIGLCVCCLCACMGSRCQCLQYGVWIQHALIPGKQSKKKSHPNLSHHSSEKKTE